MSFFDTVTHVFASSNNNKMYFLEVINNYFLVYVLAVMVITKINVSQLCPINGIMCQM